MTTESLYTPEVQRFIKSRDWPKGLQYSIYEHDYPAPHLNIVFYRDNWLTLDGEDMLKVTNIVKDIMFKLWNDGIPIYTGKMESSTDG